MGKIKMAALTAIAMVGFTVIVVIVASRSSKLFECADNRNKGYQDV